MSYFFIEYQHEKRDSLNIRYVETDEMLHQDLSILEVNNEIKIIDWGALLECKLCKIKLLSSNTFTLGRWVFCRKCYDIARERLSKFMDILLLPQDKFDKWLADNK